MIDKTKYTIIKDLKKRLKELIDVNDFRSKLMKEDEQTIIALKTRRL